MDGEPFLIDGVVLRQNMSPAPSRTSLCFKWFEFNYAVQKNFRALSAQNYVNWGTGGEWGRCQTNTSSQWAATRSLRATRVAPAQNPTLMDDLGICVNFLGEKFNQPLRQVVSSPNFFLTLIPKNRVFKSEVGALCEVNNIVQETSILNTSRFFSSVQWNITAGLAPTFSKPKIEALKRSFYWLIL